MTSTSDTILIKRFGPLYQVMINTRIVGYYPTLKEAVEAAQLNGELCGGQRKEKQKTLCYRCKFCERYPSNRNEKFPTYARCVRDINDRFLVEEDDPACNFYEEKENQNGD